MFDSIISFFMSILIFMFNLTTPSIPEAKPYEEIAPLSDMCEEYEIADTVYVLNSATFATGAHRHMAISLQGLVAKKAPSIYITSCSLDGKYLEAIEKNGSILSYTDENGEKWTLETLLEKFSHCITDSGYTLYTLTDKAEGLNIATNYSTLNGWLAVPEELEDIAINAGLTMKKDITAKRYTVLDQWSFFELNKHKFNSEVICHANIEMSGLRDLAIQQGFYSFYIDEDTDGELFRKRVMEYFGDNTLLLGWVKYEVNFVNHGSAAGNMISPSDFLYNNSILSSLETEIPEQKAVKNTYTDETKHYAAIVMSDGDNMQWIQNGYREFFEKLSIENNFPMTWSFPPLLQDLSPATTALMYNSASERDYFMAGVSGAGYMHPTQYPKKALIGFTDITSSSMAKNDMEYVQILDSTPKNEFEEEKLINSLKYYTRYDNIKGGILSLDPDRYAGGEGRVFFVDDKPFLTYRLTLWHPTGEKQNVTTEWLDEQAQKVNSYPADIHSINGYSVINVHPWSVTIDSLNYFVNQLDEDIVLVTVEEIMEMINKNIPHENAEITE